MSTSADNQALHVEPLDQLRVVPWAKLRPAVSTDRLLLRPRLMSALDDSWTTPVTVVTAPAGFGKTSTIASWTEQRSGPFAWLSLDETDRDVVQLWQDVIGALGHVAPGPSTRAATLLERPGALMTGLDQWLSDLDDGRARDPAVLILDDLHVVADAPGVSASLTLYLQYLPSWLHVVIASRATPPLPLARWRSRGQLTEVTHDQLRFSHQEACSLLSELAPGREKEWVEQAAARAGGWAVSLRLSALAAQRGAAAGLVVSPHEGHIAEYLWDEVLADESAEVVDLLIQTSVVDRVNASLAEHLTGCVDSAEVLTQAEARGLFVARAGASDWFEIHSLVRDALSTELERRSPGALARQHGRAAQWFEDHDQVAIALEHWLLAHQPRQALRLLAEKSADLYDAGREATTVRIIARLPVVTATAGLDALIEYAWCYLLVDRRRFLRLVDRGSQMLADAATEPPRPIGGRLQVLRAIGEILRGDWVRSAALARGAIDVFGPAWSSDLLGRFSWNMIAREVALSERWIDPGSEVDEATAALALDPPRSVALQGTRALGEALAGQPDRALRVVGELRGVADVNGRTILRIEVAIAEAVANREQGNRSVAIPALLELIDLSVGPVLYARLLALLELVRLRLDEGDLDTATRMFDQAMQLVSREMPGPGATDLLARTGSELALRAGDLRAAADWAGSITDEFWGPVAHARLALAQGEHAAADDALAAAVARSTRHQVITDLLRYRLGPRPDADRHLLAAARTAIAVGLVQTVASEGEEVLEGLRAHGWHLPGQWLTRVTQAAPTRTFSSVSDRFKHLVDPLTEREHQVLLLLPTSLTMREIASRLDITLNTLKTHVRTIYRKLDCGSRVEVADLVRSLHTPPTVSPRQFNGTNR